MTDGLVAYYPFNENAHDESVNYNDGTVSSPNIISNELSIGNNIEDYVVLPHNTLDGLISFTISGKLKISTLHNTGNDASNCWLSGATTSENNSFYIGYWDLDNSWWLTIDRNNYNFVDDSVEDKNWHHIVFTRNESYMVKLYIDGIPVGNGVKTIENSIDIDSGGLILGQDQDSIGGDFAENQSWAGNMDNIRIYNRSLSEEEVQALYNKG